MIPKVQNPKQTSWKIVYNEYVGMQKNAVDFLSTEVGRLLLRDEGVYTTYVLPCEKYGCETYRLLFLLALQLGLSLRYPPLDEQSRVA